MSVSLGLRIPVVFGAFFCCILRTVLVIYTYAYIHKRKHPMLKFHRCKEPDKSQKQEQSLNQANIYAYIHNKQSMLITPQMPNPQTRSKARTIAQPRQYHAPGNAPHQKALHRMLSLPNTIPIPPPNPHNPTTHNPLTPPHSPPPPHPPPYTHTAKPPPSSPHTSPTTPPSHNSPYPPH